MIPGFEHIAFREPAEAEAILAALLEGDRPALAEHLAQALSEASDPATLLVRLQRFLESVISRSQLDLLAAAPLYMRLVARVLGQSQFLTDIVCRNPEYMPWLWDEVDLGRATPREEMAAELSRQVWALSSFEARGDSMRRYARREMLRIASRDLFIHAPVSSITEDLSNLAEATLETALALATEDLRSRYGSPQHDGPEHTAQEATFAILGMGKLGGRELNFSSDIDLIFLYSDEGETSGGRTGSVSNAEFFHKLGERIIKLVSENTTEGHIFRVDMRLRPHGRMGPLATGLHGSILYYERVGQAWERQALIKTRTVAGDVELGQRFINQTRPFVYPRYFDDETLEEIRCIKRQMEAQTEDRGETGLEVKLGRGGIRDIEFTVQMLQMLNGGRMMELRAPNTLDAITRLGEFGILRPLDAAMLSSNYTFLRQVEHRLQIEGSRQCHVLPSNPTVLDEFAKRLGYASGPSFMADYRDRAEATRAVLDKFFESEGSGRLWVYDLLNPNSDGQAGLARLEGMGFRQSARARQELLDLHGGPQERPHSLHVRQQFRAMAPMLLEALSANPNPDDALLRLGQVFGKVGAPSSIYALLTAEAVLCKYLAKLAANSQFLTEKIIRDPGLFDALATGDLLEAPVTREELLGQVADLYRAAHPEAALYRLRDGNILRIGMRDLTRRADIVQVGHELTLLADVCVEEALTKARAVVTERYGAASAGFCVLGLGKLGGEELGYGSDLDLVFVYDAQGAPESGMTSSEYFAAVAAQTIRILKEPTSLGQLYDVDARLRPDGKKGVLAISIERFRDYFTQEAQTWERLALIKARAIAGDADFARITEQEARALTFAHPLTPEEVGEVDEVRVKIAAGASPLDLKKHEGGIVEIEFALRMLQLRHGVDNPQLQRGDVLGALKTLRESGLLSSDDSHALENAYLLFRRIENQIRMMNGRSGSSLPETPEARIDLAKRLDLPDDLEALVGSRQTTVHAIYCRVRDALRATSRDLP